MFFKKTEQSTTGELSQEELNQYTNEKREPSKNKRIDLERKLLKTIQKPEPEAEQKPPQVGFS